MKAIQDYIMKKCPKRKRSQLRNVLGNKYTALLLNERMVNMPAEIAPNLHKCFVEDLDWALEQSSSVRSMWLVVGFQG